jgi:MoaA/NifB/PqqE/SkfB family radical SAM enzyme
MMPDTESISYSEAIDKLQANAVVCRRARQENNPLQPQVVSLALTIRCNSHCVMCNMWRKAREIPDIEKQELTADEITSMLSRPLFSDLIELDLTGGEPFLREDLAGIVSGVAGLKETYLPRLKSIIITSNGFLPERIISVSGQILRQLQGTGIDLVHVASLDGIGEIHDRIRGTRGAYDLAVKTLAGLSELRKDYPGYYIGIKTTVLPQNVVHLDRVLQFAMAEGHFHIISPAFFTASRFRNADKKESLRLSPADRDALLEFYRRPEFDGNYFYSRIRELLSSGRRTWSCTAACNYLFIDYDGSVYPCELLDAPVGNIREKAIVDIWNGPEAVNWRRKIDHTDVCRSCIEPGAVRYSAVSEGSSYAGFLRRLGPHDYTRSLSGEGYFKYF